jgi:membrane protein DedA with SNARE-associated domain
VIFAAGTERCDDHALLARFVPAALVIAGLGLAVAIAAGAVAVPDLASAFSDATDSLGTWIYPAVAALIFVETSVLIGFLIHGELVLLVAGVAAERGDAALALLIALAAGAAVAGDVVSFSAGRQLGRPFLEHRIGAERLARVDRFFVRHGGKAVILGRFTGFLRATMPFVAGSSGMRLRRLLPLSVVSALVWSTIFVVLGFAFSESVTSAGNTATRVALVAVLVVTVAFAVRARRR